MQRIPCEWRYRKPLTCDGMWCLWVGVLIWITILSCKIALGEESARVIGEVGGRIQVFTEVLDIPPPYIVEGSVLRTKSRLGLRIVINGVQVRPRNMIGITTSDTAGIERNPMADAFKAAGDIQVQMSKDHRSVSDTYRAVKNYFASLAGVSAVEDIDAVSMSVILQGGKRFTYIIAPGVADAETGRDVRIEKIQDALRRGNALVFTRHVNISVPPAKYDLLIEELRAARAAAHGDKQAIEWKILSSTAVGDIIASGEVGNG